MCKSKWMRPDGTTLQDPDTEFNLLGNSIGGAPVCSRPQDSCYISVLCTTLNLGIVRVEAYGRLPVTICVLVLCCTVAVLHLKDSLGAVKEKHAVVVRPCSALSRTLLY